MRRGKATAYKYTLDIKAHVDFMHLLLSTQKFIKEALNFKSNTKAFKGDPEIYKCY